MSAFITEPDRRYVAMHNASSHVAQNSCCPVCGFKLCPDTARLREYNEVRVVCPKCGAFGKAYAPYFNPSDWAAVAKNLTDSIDMYAERIAGELSSD